MFRLTMLQRTSAVLISVLVCGACSVADSFHVDPSAINASAYSSAIPTQCRSTLGSYALPKSLLRIKIQSTDNKSPELVAPAVIVRADKDLLFCLDHLADPLADDDIRIIKSSGQDANLYSGGVPNQFAVSGKVENNKDYGSQLLQWVVSNTVDQSEKIAKTLIRTAFIALSGNSKFAPLAREFKAGVPATLASFEYDPFDPAQSAIHNVRLRDFGFCLVLENFTFDTRAITPEQYCSAPRRESFPFEAAYARYRSEPPPRINGIAYRPRINYALSIYSNTNPDGRGRWLLSRQYQVALENIAPIVSVGLNRSLFAARRVALKFNMGALQAMCLVKTSELQSAVTVPYEIARSIVALPTQVFEVKIGNVSDNITLLTAEKKVVAAQTEYLSFLADTAKSSYSNPTPKTAVALDKNSIPTIAITTPIEASAASNRSELESDILNRICSEAPSVVVPGARAVGGRP